MCVLASNVEILSVTLISLAVVVGVGLGVGRRGSSLLVFILSYFIEGRMLIIIAVVYLDCQLLDSESLRRFVKHTCGCVCEGVPIDD